MHQDGLSATFKNLLHILFSNLSLAVEDNLVALNRYYFTGIFINKVLIPALQHTGSQFRTEIFLQIGLVNLHLLCQVENLENVLVGFETDGTEQGGNRQFLLAVDVCVHHTIDVSSKLDP